MSEITLVGIDTAKNSFHMRAVNHRGQAIVNRCLTRREVFKVVQSFKPGTPIAMEACGGSHYWGRLFMAANYPVKLISPQYVKPYGKRQKNDKADAEAIVEAASRATMRFVAVKPVEQQDLQAIHRVRERLLTERVRLTNEIRGLLYEYGITIPQGDAALRRAIPKILETEHITEIMKQVLRELREELQGIVSRQQRIDVLLRQLARQNETCRRLMTIPGVKSVVSTALFATVGHMKFKNGRELGAFLGLVPRQHNSGGNKDNLGSITKMGNAYLRKLLVQGVRAVVQHCHLRKTPYHSWVHRLREEKGFNKAAVALANRTARIACRLMSSDAVFDPNHQLSFAETVLTQRQ